MLKIEFPIKEKKGEKEIKRKKRKRKEGFPIKDRKKAKENIQKGRWTRQCLNDVRNCHQKKNKIKKIKKTHELKHMKFPFLVINQIFVPASLLRCAKQKKKNRKGKG